MKARNQRLGDMSNPVKVACVCSGKINAPIGYKDAAVPGFATAMQPSPGANADKVQTSISRP